MSQNVPYKTIPNGWYVVSTSDELKKREIKSLRYFGRDLVLYRDNNNQARLVDAYCPHMGAHFGDGKIIKNELVCPFHGFAFDGTGRCTRTPYPTKRPPQRAKLTTYPIREQNGLILAYYDAIGADPHWNVPALDMNKWRPFTFHDWVFRGHPQETGENSVDLGHFGAVHSYASAIAVKPLAIQGQTLKSGYAVKRSLDWIYLPGLNAELRFEADVHGLGYSLVRAGVAAVGLHVRLLVLSTPIEVDRLHLRIACSVKDHPIPGLTRLVHKIALRSYAHDVSQDIPMWKSKIYIEKPLLAEGDGPIIQYRKWVQQFYPQTC
ncbi:MAG: Rieske 2Fe-2S domain-containing protein [Candidatus Nomurabacteria bacterium]|nr:MAG: Rieske 2Fe-2S domain-containing protein [Candidatus Nomurabacteria bacterium]